MIRTGIAGAAGRMGRMLINAAAEFPDLTISAAIEAASSSLVGADSGELAGAGTNGVPVSGDLTSAAGSFDVLIDFTIADATAQNLEICATSGKRMVIGTTGLSAAQRDRLEVLGEQMAIVIAPNFSVGVNATFKLVEVAAEIFGDEVDIEIVESHHRHKVDAPSGTAIRLGEAAAEAVDRKLSDVAVFGREGMTGERDRQTIGFHSLRASDVVGEHTVVFAVTGERVEITHRAHSRLNFAQGALRAAAWIADKEVGVFDMAGRVLEGAVVEVTVTIC